MAKRPKRRMNLPVVMAVVLFYLTVFSTYLTGGLYAKYIVKDSGSDAARVVKFGNVSVTETGTFTEKDGKKQFMYQPGVDLTKDVKISFTSAETDVYIFAVLETPGWAKAADSSQFTDTAEIGMSWSVDTAAGWQYLKSQDDVHVYYQYIDTNTTDFTDKQLIAENGKITVSSTTSYKKYDAVNTTPPKQIEINITAYAVQAGGFTDAAAAWASLSP